MKAEKIPIFRARAVRGKKFLCVMYVITKIMNIYLQKNENISLPCQQNFITLYPISYMCKIFD